MREVIFVCRIRSLHPSFHSFSTQIARTKGTPSPFLNCGTSTLHCFCDLREDLRLSQSVQVNQHTRAAIISRATAYFLYFPLFHCALISYQQNFSPQINTITAHLSSCSEHLQSVVTPKRLPARSKDTGKHTILEP